MSDSTVERTRPYAGGLLREIERFRNENTRPGALLYTWNVNYRIGALIARPLLTTRVTANELTLAGVAIHLMVAAYLVLIDKVTVGVSVGALILLQIAYGLDCADGQLARARRTNSPFGAWLDQVADFVSHTLILSALTVVVCRAESTSPEIYATMGAVAVGGNLLQLFATSQRNTIMGTEPAAPRASRSVELLTNLRHLSDYGFFLLLASVFLVFPTALSALLIASGVLAIGTVTGQVLLNWPRSPHDHKRYQAH